MLYVSSNLPFTIFLLRGFFEAIPREYEESIRMDGAGTIRVLRNLIVPLSLPAIAVVSMFIFSAAWDEFPVALTMIQLLQQLHPARRAGRLHRRAHGRVGAFLRRVGDRDGTGRRRVSRVDEVVPVRRLPRRDSVGASMNEGPRNQMEKNVLSELPTFHRVGETLDLSYLPGVSLVARRADASSVAAVAGRFEELSEGTYAISAIDATGAELDEEFVTVGRHQGERPVHGFATTFVEESIDEVVAWNRALRSTVVQIYDWMASYTAPLPDALTWQDPSHRPVSREGLEKLANALRAMGAVPHAYAPIYAVGLDYAAAHPEQLLYDDEGAAIRFLDQIVIAHPGDPQWQEQFARAYGEALDGLGMTGLHVDTYGYPRVARDVRGRAVDVAAAYRDFLVALRRLRPSDLISFNQVNGVPSGAPLSAEPVFRYCEIWPPNTEWRHFEGLLDRSSGVGGHVGPSRRRVRGSLACYPPVWGDGDDSRPGALATVLRTEAIATSLAASVLMFGDRRAVLKDPYYPQHERLLESEARRVLAWRRLALRTRDLFIDGEDTTWYEIDDENGSVSVEAVVPVSPEPRAGTVFARVAHGEDIVAVSLLDLSASDDGSWRSRSGEGRVQSATLRVLVDTPSLWSAEVACVERDGGRFVELAADVESHRQGRALRCEVPLLGAWSVVRVRPRGARGERGRV